MSWGVLADGDVRDLAAVDDVTRLMRLALREHAQGTLVAPPRWAVDAGAGSLVFTAGAALGYSSLGFRVYETFPEQSPDHQQLVAVWDAESGHFVGVVVGHRVGLLRTAGVNAVALDALAPADAATLGVLGTGPQARQGAAFACSVRAFDRVQAFSPTREHRETFAERMPAKLGVPVVAADDAEGAVRGADVLYCATDSDAPVFEADWLADGAHVSTLGPKSADAHELPPAVAERAAVVATDSVAQVEAHAEEAGFVLTDADRERLVELGDLVVEGVERDPGATTLFCSMGLAGTEVVLADWLLREAAEVWAGEDADDEWT